MENKEQTWKRIEKALLFNEYIHGPARLRSHMEEVLRLFLKYSPILVALIMATGQHKLITDKHIMQAFFRKTADQF